MLYIKKGPCPEEIQQKIEQLKARPSWSQIPSDPGTLPPNERHIWVKRLRKNYFDALPKDKIREALLKEQHYICAYCMLPIENDGRHMTIEHFYPLSRDKDKALDYDNLLGVCNGGRNIHLEDGEERVICCDAQKDDYSAVDLGEEFVEDEIEKIEEFEEKLREYASLGGNPELVEDVEELDKYLEKIAYLASCDLLDEQEKYMSDDYDYDEMVSTIEKAQEEKQELEDKIELFTLLGGDPDLILDKDEIDDYLEKIAYLHDNELLHRQEEFLQFDYFDMVEMIEEELSITGD